MKNPVKSDFLDYEFGN